jgi:agmatine deiminase
VVFNDLVFMCQFDTASTSYEAKDQAAATVFGTAFPGKQIIPVDCSDIIYSAGAIHCIVMHVPEPPPILKDGFESGDLSAW